VVICYIVSRFGILYQEKSGNPASNVCERRSAKKMKEYFASGRRHRLGLTCLESFQFPRFKQGCQMVYFQAKNPNLGQFLEGLGLENVDTFMAIWNILRTFGTFHDHLVHFPVSVSRTKKNLATLVLNI
jgi:hypothetical protein